MKLSQPIRFKASKKAEREVRFEYFAPSAERICLAGTFNNWDVEACPLRKDRNGNWHETLFLEPGRYEYLFFVDGSWQCDPHIKECVPNPFGSWNCVVRVE